MKAATGKEKQRLARRLKVTLPYLYHLGHGTRSISSLMAIRMERASASFPALPELHREKLSAACGECDFAKRCRRGDA
jgi:hypothetical protein